MSSQSSQKPTGRSAIRCLAVRTLIAVLLAVPCAAISQTPHIPAPVSYTRSLWRVSDGLPEDTVQALAESPDGMLWIGSTGGLAKFGGVHMQTSGIGLAQSLGVNSIFCLTVARDGSLWAGTEGGGLLHLEGASTTVFSTAQGLTDGFVRSVFEDDRRRLWVGTDNGLFQLQAGRLVRFDTGAAMPALAVHSITEDSAHRIWAGGSRLVAIDPDGTSHSFTLPGAYSENRVKTVLQAADGTLWVGTVGGLARLEHGAFVSVPGIHATVRSLLQTVDGTLWIGTIGDGLWTLRTGQLAKVKNAGLLPSETVLSMIQDDQAQVWIGTQAGLVRLNRTPVTLLPLPRAGDPDFETISGDDHGGLWVAAQNLFLVHDGTGRKVDYGLKGISVRNVFRDHEGALWIGTDGSGVYRMQDGQTSRYSAPHKVFHVEQFVPDTQDGQVLHYSAPQQLTNNFIRAFLESRKHEMWIATDEGISSLSAHGAAKFTEANGLAYFSTRCLLEDRAGTIWIGTDHGLSALKNGIFQHNEATRALAHEKVWTILEDRQGTLWFGTRDHGIFRDRADILQQYTTEQGLPANSVYQMLQDRRGTFWITGPNTIASAQEAQMDGSGTSATHPLDVTVYSMPFGADDAQLYGGREPAGYLAPDDTVWFPTNRGVAHVVPLDKTASGPPPRAVVMEVAEDGRSIPLQQPLNVPAGVTRLSFRFSAVYLRPQTQVRFRYRLDGFDGGWILVGADGLATYTNLKAGRYRFRVEAFDSSRPDAMTEAAVELKKSPRFYETVWFYLVCGLLLAAIAWAVYTVRVRQMQGRFAAVLEERSRLAREMHDTVIQGCTGVSALLEAIASTAVPAEGMNRELLDYARQQTRATIDEARQVVWDMRHEHENGVELMEAMRGYAAQIAREHKEIAIQVQGAAAIWLRASAAHEMLMVVREAVYNAVQHSGTDRIDLIANVRGDQVTVSVVDYGKGIAADMLHGSREGHYGIVGMRERAKRIGGNLDLASVPGAGMTVQLYVTHAGRLRTTEHP